MSDPRRLLGDGEANEFERELLRSWEAEQPSDAARAGVFAAVGLGGAAAAAAAVKIGAAAGGSIAPKAAATAGALAIAKWAAVMVGAAAIGATIGYVQHASHVRDQRVIVAPFGALAPSMQPASAPAIAAARDDASVALPASPADDLPAEAPAETTHPSGGTHAHPRAHASALGEQVSALDSARRALAAGDAASAIRQLDDYEARFRAGALVEEADVLRVEALLAEGDRASASRVGDRFLAAHPNSPHAARVRALLASP